MDLQLAGKTAIITGGNSGIGIGLSLHFAAEGCNVVIVGRDMDKAREVAARAEKLGGRAIALQADVTDRAAVEAMTRQAMEHFGPISVLINNAGGPGTISPFEEKDDDALNWEIDLNIRGVIHCIQAVGKTMLASGGGSIINISSASSVVPKSGMGMVNYAGTKGYVDSLTRALAFEWASKGVRVNAISPGWIIPYSREDVSSGSNWRRFAFDVFGDPDDARARIAAGTDSYISGDDLPLRRAGSPDDIARAALFLASDASSYFTGQMLSVSGGSYMAS
ncbi:SDR family NAD(P)-dependent oxidoreductase [Sphingobium estronivorans]|uniref:SDR family NAD(P)-dependent oxidoreductase n=1 Tax=Sphingobium estronivorans TaxID=1577690 RepID=UPI00123C52E2|nr:SDR family NAD(P)-dependent oxidoreductase [Sphingobium estronivorans]